MIIPRDFSESKSMMRFAAPYSSLGKIPPMTVIYARVAPRLSLLDVACTDFCFLLTTDPIYGANQRAPTWRHSLPTHTELFSSHFYTQNSSPRRPILLLILPMTPIRNERSSECSTQGRLSCRSWQRTHILLPLWLRGSVL